MLNSKTPFADTPEPPYYAVIFVSQRSQDVGGYDEMARRMVELAAQQPGFLGVESVRDMNGFGITVSYWSTEEAITEWKANLSHRAAQESGKSTLYEDYQVRVAKVSRAYSKKESVLSSSRAAPVEVRVDNPGRSEIIALLTEYLRCLAEVTPPGSMHALNIPELQRPEITFWSAWFGQELAGCGALKELSKDHGEVKSMRTAGRYLRKGVGAKVLAAIIGEARHRGYRRLSLETGAKEYFAPAHRLYETFGFQRCSAFGDYREDPNSVFMSLDL